MADTLGRVPRLRLPPVPTLAVAHQTDWILRGCASCGGDLCRDRDNPFHVATYTCLLCGRGAVAVLPDEGALEAPA